MPKANIRGLDIHYEVTGKPDNKPILLISGLGTQLTRYSDTFTEQLASRGFYVIRMDNRDIGLSGGYEKDGVPSFHKIIAARVVGARPRVPYTLDHMADDCAGLLDALGIDKAHIAGASMGGMIGQLLAIRHPEKVASLTSIMSTTGHPSLPRAKPSAQAVLSQQRSDPVKQREAYLDESVTAAVTIGSPGYPEDTDMLRARAAADLDRAFRPSGFARQYAAILAAPHRRNELAKLTIPALVIHGTDDPLVTVEGGRDTAANIPGCELVEIPGMGHNIPEALYATVCDAIQGVAARAYAGS